MRKQTNSMYSPGNRGFLGCKTKLMPEILDIIKANCKDYGSSSFLDLFGGTGIVTDKVKDIVASCHINDLLASNIICYKAFFEQGEYSMFKLEEFVAEMNTTSVRSISSNFMSDSYGEKYFAHECAKRIGYIREVIEIRKDSFTNKEYSVLLASLVYSADKVANTVGQYGSYRKGSKKEKPFTYNLISPSTTGCPVTVSQLDANDCVRKMQTDIAFVDPPYNARDYGQYYHVLEQLVKWKKDEVHGMTAQPVVKVAKSRYCTSSALDAFRDLIANLDCKYLLVTYNNNSTKSTSSKNKMSYDEIVAVLSAKGKLTVFPLKHKVFNAGKTKKNDTDTHKEFVFFVEVQEKQVITYVSNDFGQVDIRIRQTTVAYTQTRGDVCVKEDANPKLNKSQCGIQCTNVFKNQDTISASLTNLWTDIINTLENTGSMAHNDVVQSSTHHTLNTEEVGK